jgi:urate oxidase
VTRTDLRHEVRELTIAIELEGEFASSYTNGDNRLVIPTDTMKNVAYALAREHPLESIEDFGAAMAGHFLSSHAHVHKATVRITECALDRIRVNGVEHAHAFVGTTRESRICTVRCFRDGRRVESGITDLFLLKTTDSAFSGFLRDRYTTLKDSADRILATLLTAEWVYARDTVEWNKVHACVRQALVETFATHQSQSVQQTLHAMGAAALDACGDIERINLVMPNQHRILVDLKPFGLENANEIFLATDEPHGTISGTLQRA